MSTPRKLLFSAAAAALVLGLAEGGVRLAEHLGLLQTRTPDDVVLFKDGVIYVRDGDRIVNRGPAAAHMPPSEMRLDKGDGWRTFVIGASFAMGSPYVLQHEPRRSEGGIPSWLQVGLEEGGAEVPVEVINATAGGQSAHRVRRVLEEVVLLDPDVVVVATCNNEGELPPGIVSEQLRRSGGYRLLSRIIHDQPTDAERPAVALQRADPEQTATAFRETLQAMAEAAAARRVPMLLATLPLNLMLEGTGSNRMIVARRQDAGVVPECVTRARAALDAGDPAAALAAAEECEDLARGTYWTGRALLAQGRLEEARRALELAVELQPSNRCRPSFQRIIRETAAAHDHVHLLDLQAAAEARAPQGLPGGEQFVDSCHMDWQGYLAMADATRARLVELGLAPEGATTAPLSERTIREHRGRWQLGEAEATRHERPPRAPDPGPG